MSPADLLGVLAVAAAGTRLAAEAEDDAAHDLLRFVMAARRSFDSDGQHGVTSAREEERVRPAAFLAHESAAPPSPAPSSFGEDAERGDLKPTAPSPSFQPFYRQVSPPAHKGRGPVLWIAATCVLAALFMGLWLHSRPSRDAERVLDGAVRGPVRTVPDSSANRGSVTILPDVGGAATESAPPPAVQTYSRSAPARPVAPLSRPLLKSARREAAHVTDSHTEPALGKRVVGPMEVASAVPAFAIPPNTASLVARGKAPSTLLASSPNQRAATIANAGTNAIPASTLSQRLGSPGIPAYASASDETSDLQHHPRLLRRRAVTSSSASLAGSANLIAEVDSARRSPVPGSAFPGHGDAARAGIVRPISLGRMAANVLYSPSPAYPAAASAAHVQGEVKVQAEVGRDGNVIAARIISGPPLLRDAALDAVQRWRYRPYVSSGKPVPMSAMAVMDFQLP